ncbi:ATP phosphoribosyltransferase regulatory subunit [Herpetosiphon llansteffanensis]
MGYQLTPEVVRGTRDLFGAAVHQRQALIQTLTATFDQAGYDPIELPLLEHRELYLKKSGDDLIAKLYHWNQGGRDLALRPEWTASVLRAVISGLGDAPIPLRLRYAGPVFRYERPRRATYRQFTQVGIELLGAPGPLADAEALGLAVTGLRELGIHHWTLTIGHIGVIKTLLNSLGLPERITSALTWSLERIRSKGLDAVKQQWRDNDDDDLPVDLASLAHLSDQDLETLLLRVLPSLGVRLDSGGREPQAIIQRLVRKLRRGDDALNLDRAWHLLSALTAAHGPAPSVMQQMRELCTEYTVATDALDELQTTLDLLKAYGVPTDQVVLDFGMGRGLHYYTGLIFEIDGADGLQLCGGGRYDDLVAALGGRAMPAVGFAYGLERIVAAVAPAEIIPIKSVLVVGDDHSLVIQAAASLRQQGYRTAVDLRQRSYAANLNDARRREMSHLALVNADGIQLRDLNEQKAQ